MMKFIVIVMMYEQNITMLQFNMKLKKNKSPMKMKKNNLRNIKSFNQQISFEKLFVVHKLRIKL